MTIKRPPLETTRTPVHPNYVPPKVQADKHTKIKTDRGEFKFRDIPERKPNGH